jgi:thiol-disulfide isomerase/thioredoxin
MSEVDREYPLIGTFTELLENATRGQYPSAEIWTADAWKQWGLGDLAKRETAPTFTRTTLEGSTFDLEKVLAVKPVLIIFFNRRCPHCVKEMPEIQKFLNKNQEELDFQPVAITINVDGTESENEEIRKYVKEYRLKMPMIVENLAETPKGHLFDQYRVQSIPSWGVIGRDGKFRLARSGEHPDVGSALKPVLEELHNQ